MKKIILILSVLLLKASFVMGQYSTAAVDIPFTVKCGTAALELHFGVDPSATDKLDPLLGELPLPPLPPEGVLDARLMSLNDSDGSLRDYRAGTAKFNGTRVCTLKVTPGTDSQVKILFDLPKHVSLTIKENSGTILPEKSINGKDTVAVSLTSTTTFYMTVLYELGIVVPGAPVLSKPDNHSTGLGLNPTLSWNTTEWAKVYQLLVASDEAFTKVVYCDTNLTSASAQIGSLKHGTKYYWKVRAKNSEGSGAYSNTWSFATSAAVDLPLTVKCGTAKQDLFFGLDSSATDGLDADLGETPLPPLPPSGVLDARFMVANDDNGSPRDYRKGTDKFTGTVACTLKVTPGASKEVKLLWILPEHVTIKIKDKSGTILPEKTITGKDSVTISLETTTNLYMTAVYELGAAAPKAPSGLTAAASVFRVVTLTWKDESDNEAGFRVLRKEGDSLSKNPFVVIKDVMANQTSYIDSTVNAGTMYSYLIGAFSKDSLFSYSSLATVTTISSVELLDTKPVEYGLMQNYPNPFNPSTTIRFTVKEPSHVKLTIYNQLGETVGELLNEVLNGGTYEKVWNAGKAPSGYYFYELRTDSYRAVKKMLLLK